MADNQSPPAGPDLALGVSPDDFKNDMLLGHVGEADVLVVRAGSEIFAIDAHCSHYHGPLADGLVTGHDVRCPWHHACFDLRTGEAVRAPALSPLSVWKVEQREGRIFVTQKRDAPQAKKAPSDAPKRIVIVGGGAAGFAAAEMLRRDGYGGEITMLSSDSAPPVDRPNLSKDYLAGSAPEDWIPLRPESFYADEKIDLKLATNVAAIDAKARHVALADGKTVPYDRLLLATGAEPVRLPIPGADERHVHILRSLDDSSAIIANAKDAKRAIVIGASFIGLEAAASLRARDIEVHVVAPEARPMERILGPDMGDFVRALHEEHGVIFHLGDTVTAIEGKRATLKSGGNAGGRSGRGRRRRASAPRFGRAGGIGHRPRRHRQRVARDQRARHLCRRRYRALARSAFEGEHPRRALGGGAAPGPDRGAQHAGRARGLRCRAVLLEPALRRADQLCRPRRKMGRDRRRRRHQGPRLRAALQAEGHACWRSPRSTATSTV